MKHCTTMTDLVEATEVDKAGFSRVEVVTLPKTVGLHPRYAVVIAGPDAPTLTRALLEIIDEMAKASAAPE